MVDRKSKIPDQAERETLYSSEEDRVNLEARNALRQFDFMIAEVQTAISQQHPYSLRLSTICELNRLAIDGVMRSAGVLRSKQVIIDQSAHTPPPSPEIPRHVEEMCDYVNSHLDASPIHIAAYLLWRLNWIHPFVDGNGRTSRAVSYMMLCLRLGFVLPGPLSIPEQIVSDKQPYYDGLDAADAAWKNGEINVGVLEEMLSELLAEQLLSIHDSANDGTL